ncbi:sodium- and chloride-dependent GABA transporter 1-like [Clavelina lepadiformis]|uniref:sodium- and chloride-dependent GABA transporter 1-like n=1 Tax=Clavelina lepadiformis TaxID=159417 RepID=UPI00404349FC
MGMNSLSDKPRQTWRKRWDFILSSAGVCIGLGNIWRFPYLCFKYGGGAFLLPYWLSVIVLAIPLLILDISLGQSIQKGVIASWSTVPIFKGIAFACATMIFHSNLSYPIILVWVSKYLVSSFNSRLPWATCDNEWNRDGCVGIDIVTGVSNTSAFNTTSAISILTNVTNQTQTMSSAEQFWNYEVLEISSGLEELGSLRLDLVLYLGLIWILGYLAIFKGIKWSAKVVYFTATVPIVLILVVVVRGATLEGASLGIYHYLTPNVTLLKDTEVWVGAATQVLYSFCVATGSLTTLGSYNKYNQNFLKDILMIVLSNCLASFLCGFAVFSTLGSMAHAQNQTMDEVAQSGPGLIFIVYPQALTFLPLPQFWNAIFFLTIFLMGFDSQLIYVEAFCALFLDYFRPLRTFHKYSRPIFLAFGCLGFYLSGLIFVTKGGVYVFEIFNTYGMAGWSLFFIAACECIAIGWVYGAHRHWDEINRMIGPSKIRPVIIFIWKYVGPILCVLVSIYYVAVHSRMTYGNYIYPPWAQVLCHFVSASSALWIPLYAVYITIVSGKSWRELRRQENSKKPMIGEEMPGKCFDNDEEVEML